MKLSECIEQFQPCGEELIVFQQCAPQEDGGQGVTFPDGVGLEVTLPVARLGGESEQPIGQGSERGDEEQDLDALRALGTCVAQSEAPSVALEVAEGFFDLHTLGVELPDGCTGMPAMGQRGGKQPGRTVEDSVELLVGGVVAPLSGSAGSTMVSPQEVEMACVASAAAQSSKPDVAHVRGGLAIQAMAGPPALRVRAEVLDAFANSSDPIPTEGFHVTKPRATEAGIGDDDGLAVRRQYSCEVAQEATMDARIVVAAHGMRLLVDRVGPASNRHGRFQDEHLALEFAISPIHDDDGTLKPGDKLPRHGLIDAKALAVQMDIAEQSVDSLDVVLHVSGAGAMAAEFREAEPASSKRGVDYSNEGFEARGVANAVVARKPVFDQAESVHVVLSDRDGCVATPIGSDDDMHVHSLSA